MSKPVDIPFETTLLVRDTCLCLHVQRAARALARRFDEALRPLGLTNGQFSLMMSLNRPEPPAIEPFRSLGINLKREFKMDFPARGDAVLEACLGGRGSRRPWSGRRRFVTRKGSK